MWYKMRTLPKNGLRGIAKFMKKVVLAILPERIFHETLERV